MTAVYHQAVNLNADLPHCTSPGSIRLVAGTNKYEGRVEICTKGLSWSTVCDDFWGFFDAQVVCRQLGYSEKVIALSNAYFGQGIAPILLDNVHCNGSEASLLDCKHLNQSNCAHNSDAGVRCQGKYNCKILLYTCCYCLGSKQCNHMSRR